MMKHIRTILICTLMVLSAQVFAQRSNNNGRTKAMTAEQIRRYNIRRFDIHNIAVWGGAGYSAMLHKNDASIKLVGGAGGMIGVGYEYNYKHVIFSVGPELRMLSSTDKMTLTEPYAVHGLDYNQTKLYYLSDMSEQQFLTQLMLPMMVGGQWDYMYFKAGVKVGYTVLGTYGGQFISRGAIVDPAAYSEWNNIPTHYNAITQSNHYRGQNPFGLDVALSAEVGVNLDKLLNADWQQENEDLARPMRMRIALFADYGVYNSTIQSNQPFATCTADAITAQSWQNSEWGSNPLNSFLIGAKFTWMLQMNKIKAEKKYNGYLTVRAYDNVSLASLASTSVQIKSVATKKTSKKTTNSKGIAAVRQPEGEYIINAQRNGYDPVVDMAFYHGEDNDTAYLAMHKIFVPEPEPVVVDTFIPLPEVEQPIVLDNLFFVFGKTIILPESEESLNYLYRMLESHPNIRIRITGHTDSVGSDEDNQILSEGRANSVCQNMIDRGIDPARIEAEGKGESMPIDTNDTEEGRQHNRRVEFMIIE